MATLYVDYKNGNDAGDGSSGSPLKTLTHCLASHANNNDTIKLRGGSATDEIYRETGISTSKTGLIIENDAGHNPQIWGSMPYTSWSLTAGQSATYEAACLANACYMVWSGATLDTWFASKSSIAEVEATENSFWLDAANDKLYAHVTGGGNPGTLEAQALPGKSPSLGLALNGAGSTVRGLLLRHHLGCIEVNAAATISGCTTWHQYHASSNSGTGFYIPTSGAVLIENCRIHLKYGKGIHCSTGSTAVTMRNCTIDSDGILASGYGIWIRAGTGHVIENCTITGFMDGIYAIDGTGCIVRRCTFIDNQHADCIWEQSAVANAYGNQFYYTGALVDAATHHGLVLHNYGDVYVNNNVFAWKKRNMTNGDGDGLHIAPMSNTQTLHARNNIFYNMKMGVQYSSGTVVYDIGNNAFYGNTNDFVNVDVDDQGTGNVTTDPQFVNPLNYDFRLLPTSPCIDAGALVTGINEGFRGGAPDIGAHEYVRPRRHRRR